MASIDFHATYIWAEAFEKHSNSALVEETRNRDIDRLVVNTGFATPQKKLADFRRKLRDNPDIELELLLAPNHWTRSGGLERAESELNSIDFRDEPLHLDIEPHTFDDFEKRRETYLQRYLEVIELARDHIGENQLSVSVPFFWPDRIYRKLSKKTDRIYLMAYGEKSVEARLHQVEKLVDIVPKEMLVVALETRDYASRADLKRMKRLLNDELSVETFAIHPFRRYADL